MGGTNHNYEPTNSPTNSATYNEWGTGVCLRAPVGVQGQSPHRVQGAEHPEALGFILASSNAVAGIKVTDGLFFTNRYQ